MKLNVKILQGKECHVEVDEDAEAIDIKMQVALKLDVPVEQQRLIHRGKPLPDNKSVKECGLKDGIKLFLIVKKSDETTNVSIEPSQPDFWSEMSKFLRKHFTEEDADKVLYQYKEDFEQTIASLSLDDIERLATANLEKTATCNS